MSEDDLLAYCHRLYIQHGLKALGFAFLKRHRGLYWALYQRGITQRELLRRLDLKAEFKAYKATAPLVRHGQSLARWTWQRIVAEASDVKRSFGFVPPAGWFRDNGYQSLVQSVYYLKRNWEDLRPELGDPPTGSFVESRNGLRWRSHPEASLSNFLYARGVPHRCGDKYPADYAAQSGRTHGYYDLHFKAGDQWLDVEVWGDNPRGTGTAYQQRRAQKEAFNRGNQNFVGIHFEDCFDDTSLTDILSPYIGLCEPFQFDRPTDPIIPSTHWSNTDELLQYCRHLAAQLPGGAFPTEEWLRKRGKWAHRPGPAYNTLSVYIKFWFGGVRKLRALLGQEHVSTNKWDRDAVLTAWLSFWNTHGLTPNQVRAHSQRGQATFGDDVVREAGRLVSAVVKYAGGAQAANAAAGITIDRTRVARRPKKAASAS